MEDLDIKFYNRTIGELRSGKELSFEDPSGILKVMSEKVKETLLANPSVITDDDVCQIIALDGNRVIGSELSFPNKYVVGGEIKPCRGASTLFTEEAYRKYAVGTDLMINAATISPKQDNIVGGISQMAYPLYKAMRYACFPFKRYIFLRKSRVAVEYILKRRNVLTNTISAILDFFMGIYRLFTFCGNLLRMRNYTVEKVDRVPEEVENIVLDDGHKYKELHDRAWFEWNLKYSFNEDDRNSKYLAVIKNKKGEIVGFFLNKIEFFAQASSRGFKNVLLGTVSEWGIKKGEAISEYDILMTAVRHLPKTVDGAEVATTDLNTGKRFKHHLLFPMGEANMAAYIQSFKDKSIKDINNWRIRLAAGDTLLN